MAPAVAIPEAETTRALQEKVVLTDTNIKVNKGFQIEITLGRGEMGEQMQVAVINPSGQPNQIFESTRPMDNEGQKQYLDAIQTLFEGCEVTKWVPLLLGRSTDFSETTVGGTGLGTLAIPSSPQRAAAGTN